MTNLTKPTSLTNKQYESGVFAIDRKNADHYLMYGNVGNEFILENSLWVCRDVDSMRNTNPTDQPSYEVAGVYVIVEDGSEEEIEAITFSTKESLSGIDLVALAEGYISWV